MRGEGGQKRNPGEKLTKNENEMKNEMILGHSRETRREWRERGGRGNERRKPIMYCHRCNIRIEKYPLNLTARSTVVQTRTVLTEQSRKKTIFYSTKE